MVVIIIDSDIFTTDPFNGRIVFVGVYGPSLTTSYNRTNSRFI